MGRGCGCLVSTIFNNQLVYGETGSSARKSIFKKCIKLKSDYLFLQNTIRDFMLTYEFSCLEQCDKMPRGLQIPVFNNKWCIFNPSFMLLEIKEIPGRQHWMVGAAAESLLSLSSAGFRSQSTKQQTFSSKMREKFSQQSCCQKPSAARSRVPVTHSCNSSPLPCWVMLQRKKSNVLN